jgi:hypothetical protein
MNTNHATWPACDLADMVETRAVHPVPVALAPDTSWAAPHPDDVLIDWRLPADPTGRTR